MDRRDVLIAGAGRADVRAGVMNLLSTVATVHSERAGAAISITTEKAPDVTVDHDVQRVTAADVLH